MSEKHLQRRAHFIRARKGLERDAWWYEDPDGLYVCIESHNGAGDLAVKVRKIPWASIRSALKRLDKP